MHYFEDIGQLGLTLQIIYCIESGGDKYTLCINPL